MAFSWVFRRLVESHLNKPPFCADRDKNNESFSISKCDETNNLELSVDLTNQWKETPMFKKKCVYYFSPAYLSKDDPSTMDSLYKFYLKTLRENDPRYKTNTNSFKVAKTYENERSDSSLHDKKHNVQEKFPIEKYAKSCTVSEKQFLIDFANRHSASPLGQVFDILHYYFIFPFYVSKLIFDVSNSETGYYCVRFPNTSDLNMKSPDIDIYSIDDQTFENFCLKEEEENVEEPPCSLLPTNTEFETKDMKKNDGDYDQKYSSLISEVYKPYYTMDGETQDNIRTSDQCQTNYIGSEPDTSFMDKYFRSKEADKESHLDITASERKFKTSLNLEKYDFSLAKLLRKLASMKEMKLKDKETGSITDH